MAGTPGRGENIPALVLEGVPSLLSHTSLPSRGDLKPFAQSNPGTCAQTATRRPLPLCHLQQLGHRAVWQPRSDVLGTFTEGVLPEVVLPTTHLETAAPGEPTALGGDGREGVLRVCMCPVHQRCARVCARVCVCTRVCVCACVCVCECTVPQHGSSWPCVCRCVHMCSARLAAHSWLYVHACACVSTRSPDLHEGVSREMHRDTGSCKGLGRKFTDSRPEV